MARHYASNKKATGRSGSAFTIPEDESAVAMMPQSVVYRSVESPYHSLPEEYESDIEGCDAQIKDDNRQMMKGFRPTKV
jgi:hypothetical protein